MITTDADGTEHYVCDATGRTATEEQSDGWVFLDAKFHIFLDRLSPISIRPLRPMCFATRKDAGEFISTALDNQLYADEQERSKDQADRDMEHAFALEENTERDAEDE